MTDLKLLDGAMGSEFIRRGEILPPHTWSADVNLTNPDLLSVSYTHLTLPTT